MELLIRELEKAGWERSQIVVRIDNRKHVQYKPGFHSNEESEYSIWHRQIVATSVALNSRWVGRMDDDGVALIVEGLLRMEQHSENMLPAKLVKKLRQWLNLHKSK